ncbi:TetR/AcrR family transcriptional regulator [Ottowia sp.]|uniref:TetR/AcrR family transcriptional regulator n=1 Tax=Ottowia sp. TaxID=1898956 RepID=UPI003A86A0E6
MPDSAAKNTPTLPRRTQEARSAETRQRLMNAALDLLSERGYEQVSTTMMARRAGVSNGALTHHFPSKTELMGAAFEALIFEWHEACYRNLHPNEGPDRLANYIRYYWRTAFNHPRYLAVVELMLTARGDEALGARMRQGLERFRPTRVRIERALLGFDIHDPVRGPMLDLCLSMLRGMALPFSANPDKLKNEVLLETWLCAMAPLLQNIEQPQPAHPAPSDKG